MDPLVPLPKYSFSDEDSSDNDVSLLGDEVGSPQPKSTQSVSKKGKTGSTPVRRSPRQKKNKADEEEGKKSTKEDARKAKHRQDRLSKRKQDGPYPFGTTMHVCAGYVCLEALQCSVLGTPSLTLASGDTIKLEK